MKLAITNVGPFSGRQEIHLDGITILAGLNGVGKSTFGKVLYCVFSSFYDIEEKVTHDRERTIRNFIFHSVVNMNYQNRALVGLFVDNAEQLWRKLKQISDNIEDEAENDITINEFLGELFGADYDPDVGNMIKKQIREVMRISDDKIRAKMVENYIDAEFGGQIWNINSTEKKAEIELSIKDRSISFICGTEGISIKEYMSLVKSVLYFDDPNVADYLDSSRMSAILDEKSHKSDLLRKLKIKNNQQFSSVDQILIQEKIKRIEDIINRVCDGDITVTDSRQFSYLSKDFTEGLNIGNMATGLKSFAVLKLLLKKGCLEENGTVIFDEPEIHLHPEWQRIWAEIIVLLHKELDLHVLISTHSSDFLGFLELYVHKYNITDKTNLYQLVKDDQAGSHVVNAGSDWDIVYRQLGTPFLRATEELDEINDES